MSLKLLVERNSIFVVVTLIFVAICLLVYKWWDSNRRLFELGSKIPGIQVENAHILEGKSHNEILGKAIQFGYPYGNVTKGWLGLKLLVFLTHPEDVEVILGSSVHVQKSDEYRFFKPWLGNGLLVSSGEYCRRHRNLIAPAFDQNILKTFAGLFYKKALIAVQRLEKNIGKEFDVHDIMSETTVDILLESVMGVKSTAQGKKRNEYVMAVMKMCDIICKRTYNALYKWGGSYHLTGVNKNEGRLLDSIHELTTKAIQKKHELYTKKFGEVEFRPLPFVKNYPVEKEKQTATSTHLWEDLDFNTKEENRLAFLDLMVETAKTGGLMMDEEIMEEVNTIMFKGHDTTATSLSFTLCLLGVHQDIQEKVYEELYGIFGDSDRAPTFADIMKMKYLERVILESLRLYPPVPAIARKLTEEVKCASEDYRLPKGCTVIIATYLMHRRSEFYPNPNEFNPDNFLPEITQNRHYYSYIPFSAGPRICVGRKYAMMNLKVLLSTVLRNYKVKSNVKESEFKLQADIILKRADGFRIELERRHA